MKRISVGVAALLAVPALVSCGDGDGTAGATGDCDPSGLELNVKFLEQASGSVERARDVMEDRYPGLKVVGEPSPIVSYDELTQEVVADSASGTDIDVVLAGNNNYLFYVDNFDAKPLDESGLLETYRSEFTSIGTVDGELYMAPYQVSVPVIYWNKDLFAEAGLDPDDPPTNYTELVDAARALKDVGDAAPVSGYFGGTTDFLVQALVQSNGATYINDDGTAGFDSPEGIEALELIHTLGEEGLMDPISTADGLAAFTSGQTAMTLVSSANATAFATDIGGAFDFGIALMPVADQGTPVFPAGGNGWLSLADDECENLYASELIGELISPESIIEAAELYSYVPVDEEALATLLEDPDTTEPEAAAYQLDVDLTRWGGWPSTHTVEANLAVQDMYGAILRGKDTQSAVTSTVEAINRLLDS